MNEQQRAELERIRDVLYPATGLEDYDEEIIGRVLKDINALLAQDALDKMAENARELGLSYDDAVKGGVGIMLGGKRIDPASIYAEPKIGCVNHDCDKCKAVQEPSASRQFHEWAVAEHAKLNASPPAPPVQEWMKPHPKCDEACLFQCTKGFTQFPECAITSPAAPTTGKTK